MSVSEGVGLRAAVRHYYDSPPRQLARRPLINDPQKELLQIAEILVHIDDCRNVTRVIAAAGARRLWIMPSDNAPPLMSGVADAVLTAGFAGQQMAAGDPLLLFNPQNYLALGSEEIRGSIVQHALWEIFLRQAFPGLGQDLARVRQAAGRHFPAFPAYFLSTYFNFLVRVAAMEAQCFGFAAIHSTSELLLKERSITEEKEALAEYKAKAALFSGLLFAHVFGFELFPEHAAMGRHNLRKIKGLMAAVLNGQQVRDEEERSRAMLNEALMPGQTPRDVRLDGHYRLVMDYWEKYFRAGEQN